MSTHVRSYIYVAYLQGTHSLLSYKHPIDLLSFKLYVGKTQAHQQNTCKKHENGF